MLFYNNNSSTAVIVLHEIYGINSHIMAVCDKLAKYGFDVIAPNLLNQEEPYDYREEKAAYNNFKENIGFNQACSQIKALLNKVKESHKKSLSDVMNEISDIVTLYKNINDPFSNTPENISSEFSNLMMQSLVLKSRAIQEINSLQTREDASKVGSIVKEL